MCGGEPIEKCGLHRERKVHVHWHNVSIDIIMQLSILCPTSPSWGHGGD